MEYHGFSQAVTWAIDAAFSVPSTCSSAAPKSSRPFHSRLIGSLRQSQIYILVLNYICFPRDLTFYLVLLYARYLTYLLYLEFGTNILSVQIMKLGSER